MSKTITPTEQNPYRNLFVVIAYDITSDKRRNQLINLLKNHGYRVNYSVFECELNQLEFKSLKNKIRALIEPMEDSVLYYKLCKTCVDHMEKTGTDQLEFKENSLFF